MTTPVREPETGLWATQHGARALQEERRSHLHGAPLSDDTELAIRDTVDRYVADRGKCNAIEQSLIRDMALCDLIRDSVIAESCRRKTLFGTDGALLPVFKTLATYLNTKRLHAMALGIRLDTVDRLGTICSRCGDSFNDLQSYLHHQPCTPPAPPASATATVDAEASPNIKVSDQHVDADAAEQQP